MKKITKVALITTSLAAFAAAGTYLTKKYLFPGKINIPKVKKMTASDIARALDESSQISELDFTNYTEKDAAFFTKLLLCGERHSDPFWDEAARVLANACVGLLADYCGNKVCDAAGPLSLEDKKALIYSNRSAANGVDLVSLLEPNEDSLMELVTMAMVLDKGGSRPELEHGAEPYSELDTIFSHIEKRLQDAGVEEVPYCVKMWRTFKLAPEKTRTSVAKDLLSILEKRSEENLVKGCDASNF